MVNKKLDTSIPPKWEHRSPLPFDNKETQAEIVMAEKNDTDPNSCWKSLLMTGMNKSIIAPQKAVLSSLYTTKEQLGNLRYFSSSERL